MTRWLSDFSLANDVFPCPHNKTLDATKRHGLQGKKHHEWRRIALQPDNLGTDLQGVKTMRPVKDYFHGQSKRPKAEFSSLRFGN